jgi:hypothetical protein
MRATFRIRSGLVGFIGAPCAGVAAAEADSASGESSSWDEGQL